MLRTIFFSAAIIAFLSADVSAISLSDAPASADWITDELAQVEKKLTPDQLRLAKSKEYSELVREQTRLVN